MEKVNTTIKTDLLDYPSVLGDNTKKKYLHGCIIYQHFREQGVEEPQDIYKILSFTAEKKDIYNELCLQSTHCEPIIRKFQNGTYKAKYENGDGTDDIFIGHWNDEYHIVEGKHRVCMAKRFGITEIPVVLEIYPNPI